MITGMAVVWLATRGKLHAVPPLVWRIALVTLLLAGLLLALGLYRRHAAEEADEFGMGEGYDA